MAKPQFKSKKQVEKEKAEAEKQKIIAKRKKEYGSADVQLENILEAINSGADPAEALENEAQRVQQIKEKYPKDG